VETKEWLVGFYVLDCASEGEALERAAAICDRSAERYLHTPSRRRDDGWVRRGSAR
jgi:hypothetical protein